MRKFLMLFICFFSFATSSFAMANTSPKVYDGFIFYNELELLDIRLHELDEVVDYFILVEATKTFQGKHKPLYFADNKERYARFLHKIIHIVVDDMPRGGDPWPREFHQRNCIARGLKDASDEDIVMISDVDEIPRLTHVKFMKNRFKLNDRYTFMLSHYVGYMNKLFIILPGHRKGLDIDGKESYPKVHQLHGVTALSYKEVKGKKIQSFRRDRTSKKVQFIINAGWHFTSQGGVKLMQLKYQSYSHLNSVNVNVEELERRLNSLYNLQNRQIAIFVPIDSTFPKYVQENQEYFEKIGYIKNLEGSNE